MSDVIHSAGSPLAPRQRDRFPPMGFAPTRRKFVGVIAAIARSGGCFFIAGSAREVSRVFAPASAFRPTDESPLPLPGLKVIFQVSDEPAPLGKLPTVTWATPAREDDR